jgi:cytochrome P450
MFSAPADVLHPARARACSSRSSASRSVLLLDGAEHLAQRKLMLPAFHGERMRALTGVMEEVAAAEVAGWRPAAVHAARAHAGADARGDPARRVRHGRGPQLDELRTTLKQLLDLGASPLTLLPLFRRNLGRLTTWQRFVEVRDRADELILALIEERRRTGEEGDDVLTHAARRARRGPGSR